MAPANSMKAKAMADNRREKPYEYLRIGSSRGACDLWPTSSVTLMRGMEEGGEEEGVGRRG